MIVESHKFKKNHNCIRLINKYTLGRIRVNYVNLNQPNILKSSKPNSQKNLLAEVRDAHLRTTTNDEHNSPLMSVSRKTEISYVENMQK